MMVDFRWLDKMDSEHLDLRHRVLRVGRPRETANYPGVDDDPRTKFLGAFSGDKLVGCSTLQFDQKGSAKLRIRGMAVDSDFRGKGIGSDLVKILQDFASEMNTGIWCNARIKAISMYQRSGFTIQSDLFEIEEVGLHYRVQWNPDQQTIEEA